MPSTRLAWTSSSQSKVVFGARSITAGGGGCFLTSLGHIDQAPTRIRPVVGSTQKA